MTWHLITRHDDMEMEKYHLEDKEPYLEALYLASQTSLIEQAMAICRAKLNEATSIVGN